MPAGRDLGGKLSTIRGPSAERSCIIEAYAVVNPEESQLSVMTYRFEVEEFLNTYILEDYYCTNPFCECNHVTISLSDQENSSNRLMFLLNFKSKTHGLLPDAPKLSQEQTSIIKEFISNVPEEQMVLF